MQTFTIRDIENLTAIKAHTLRIWEQRYGLFAPKRKESRHRIYDNEDLKQLLHISFLYHLGWKAAKLAQLTAGQRKEAVERLLPEVASHEALVSQLIESAIRFDEPAFLWLLNAIVDRIGFDEAIVKVCYPYLQRIGLLWATSNIIPAQEHFSSYIIQNRIITETEKLVSGSPAEPEILLFCPRGEQHELSLLFINYLLRKHGWGTIFLGRDVKLDEAAQVLDSQPLKAVYLHLITNFTGFEVDDYLEAACKAFFPRPVFASGTGVHAAQRQFRNLVLLRSDGQIRELVANKQRYLGIT